MTVSGRYTVADIFKPRERCGVYVLHFSNGECYVGLAIDIVRRFAQHRIRHRDIASISFKRVPINLLSEEEKRVIGAVEECGFKLRNIQLVSIVRGETDFDLLMSVAEQEAFVADLDFDNTLGEKLEIEAHRVKYTHNYLKISQLPYFDEFVQSARLYVMQGIPIPKKSEYSFWCLSAPSSGRFSRININWQEVATFVFERANFRVTLHTAYSPLAEMYGDDLNALFEQFESLELLVNNKGEIHTYVPGGQDQIAFAIPGDIFRDFLALPIVIGAIRLFNVRLMRKGPTIYNRYHSFDLSGKILAYEKSEW